MSRGGEAPWRWRMQATPIATRWASCVNPANPWPEYPRPQMVREHWQNLNGLWEYAITGKHAPVPQRYQGHILVPYPVESALSGVKQSLQPDQLLWYRRTLHGATEGFFVDDTDPTPQSRRYQECVQEFRNGCRDLSFLRRLALMALRLGDQRQATEVSNEFVSRAPEPYTKQTWQSVAAVTRSVQDKGFDLFRAKAEEVNALLGAQAAERKILDIITREVVAPYFRGERRDRDWSDFEQAVADRHGSLGSEAVLGARMMDELLKEDWASFGIAYRRYFATAIPRSPYSLHNLSYQILTHVNGGWSGIGPGMARALADAGMKFAVMGLMEALPAELAETNIGATRN